MQQRWLKQKEVTSLKWNTFGGVGGSLSSLPSFRVEEEEGKASIQAKREEEQDTRGGGDKQEKEMKDNCCLDSS